MRLPCVIILTLALAAPIAAQSGTGTPDAKTVAFTQRLLAAIGHRDVEALAGMFTFPATVRSGSITLPIANSAALAKAFDTVFTPELGCALEKGATQGTAEPTRTTANGLTIGRGAVHLQPAGDAFKITRIDEPAGAAPAAPRSKPRVVDLPSGQVQLSGTLAAGGADRYVVSSRPGDVVQGRIERFEGRAAGVRVVDVKTGKVLSTGLDAARVASATAQQGDVAVEVTRLTFCEPSVSYLLTLSKHR